MGSEVRQNYQVHQVTFLTIQVYIKEKSWIKIEMLPFKYFAIILQLLEIKLKDLIPICMLLLVQG